MAVARPSSGPIAMDALMVDVTDVPGVGPDDECVLLGAQGGERIDAPGTGATAHHHHLGGGDAMAQRITPGVPCRRRRASA